MRSERSHLNALLCSAQEPSQEQLKRFTRFLEKKYGDRKSVV